MTENIRLAYDLYSNDLYKIGGSVRGGQTVIFHNQSTLILFIILLNEFFCESEYSIRSSGRSMKVSLFGATKDLAGTNKENEKFRDLLNIILRIEKGFNSAIDKKSKEGFANLTYQNMLNYYANYHKHNLLRLDRKLKQFSKICPESSEDTILKVFFDWLEKMEDKFIKFSTYMLEIMYPYFEMVNIITRRDNSVVFLGNRIISSKNEFKKRFAMLVPKTDYFLIPENMRRYYSRRKQMNLDEMCIYLERMGAKNGDGSDTLDG